MAEKREAFYLNRIKEEPKNEKRRKGWINRARSFALPTGGKN